MRAIRDKNKSHAFYQFWGFSVHSFYFLISFAFIVTTGTDDSIANIVWPVHQIILSLVEVKDSYVKSIPKEKQPCFISVVANLSGSVDQQYWWQQVAEMGGWDASNLLHMQIELCVAQFPTGHGLVAI